MKYLYESYKFANDAKYSRTNNITNFEFYKLFESFNIG